MPEACLQLVGDDCRSRVGTDSRKGRQTVCTLLSARRWNSTDRGLPCRSGCGVAVGQAGGGRGGRIVVLQRGGEHLGWHLRTTHRDPTAPEGLPGLGRSRFGRARVCKSQAATGKNGQGLCTASAELFATELNTCVVSAQEFATKPARKLTCFMTSVELLANVRVASPCTARWADMTGDERARFCAQCQKHVYNLSEMTAEAASSLIREKEGKLCVRFYQRADGTVLTADCPVGTAAVVRRV